MKYIYLIHAISLYACHAYSPSIKNSYSTSLFAGGSSNHDSPIPVMVNGMPGLMALETAKSCLDNGLELIATGFTGESTSGTSINVEGKSIQCKVDLVKGPGLVGNTAKDILNNLKLKYPNLVVIDYTHPSAVYNNIQAYVECNCDFVMGTTGGESAKMIEIFNSGKINAIIAPNMAKQIVATQAALLDMSKKYPNSFKNYKLTVTESHQSNKADTSGTAKALVSYMSTLNGAAFSFEEIVMLRDRDSQLKFGVPEDALSGHAFHTYRLTSPDGSVAFELKHNVCGRRVYADGTVDGVKFIHKIRHDNDFAKKVRGSQTDRRLFNMIDVLENDV